MTTSQEEGLLQLRGRRLHALQPINPAAVEILPQQLGYERFKYSRYIDKQVVKICINQISISQQVQQAVLQEIQRSKGTGHFRLKFEIGDFHCFTKVYKTMGTTVTVNEDLQIDLNEHKYMKVHLVAIRGKYPPRKPLLNELAYEHVVSFATIKLSDFLQDKPIACNIPLNNKQFVHPLNMIHEEHKNTVESEDPVIKCAIELMTVNGAEDSVFMEGNQLLVGRHCIYQNACVAKVLSIKRNGMATIEILKTQPNYQKVGRAEAFEVMAKGSDLKPIERYGISQFKAGFYTGEHEWQLNIQLANRGELELLASGVNYVIQQQQVKSMYDQRTHIDLLKNYTSNDKLISGCLHVWILGAQSLRSQVSGESYEAKVNVSLRQVSEQPQFNYLDIMNDDEFIACTQTIREQKEKDTATPYAKSNASQLQWVTQDTPQGAYVNMGHYMKKFPQAIHFEIMGKKDDEVLGVCELDTERALNLSSLGNEFFLNVEDIANKSGLVRIRTLFQPANGTMRRLNMKPEETLFNSAQQYLYYKILKQGRVRDQYGYLVGTGTYANIVAHKHTVQYQIGKDDASERMTFLQKLVQDRGQSMKASINLRQGNDSKNDASQFHEIMHGQQHEALEWRNVLRPQFEENLHLFRHLWHYQSYQVKNKALLALQSLYWKQFQAEVMLSKDHQNEQGINDSDIKSLKSKFAFTNDVMNNIYKRRSIKKPAGNNVQQPLAAEEEFSALFISRWEEEGSWKYADIWNLIKYGIPDDQMRVSLWKDLTRQLLNQKLAEAYLRDNNYPYNDQMTVYENLRHLGSQVYTSKFIEQIGEDMKMYRFPQEFQAESTVIEQQKRSIENVLRAFSIWSIEYSRKRNLTVVYSKGYIKIIQRLLTLIKDEEDVFWVLIGFVKSLKKITIVENDQQQDSYLNNSPLLSRRICLKNIMVIVNCLIKLHHPEVFAHLKALAMPIEWYFQDAFESLYAECFSSDLVLRLWDMIILSSTNGENKKRALWWLLALPLYMVNINNTLILQSKSPLVIKDLLTKCTAASIYTPTEFIESLLSIIKNVFVEKEGVFSRVLKNDDPNQLEKMREEVERSYLHENFQDIEFASELAKKVMEQRPTLEVQKIPGARTQEELNSQDRATLRLKIVALRNVPLSSVQQFHIAVRTDDQVKKSDLFTVAIVNNDSPDLSVPVDKIVYIESEVYSRINNGILTKNFTIELHSKLRGDKKHLGSASVDLKDVLNSLETYQTLKLIPSAQASNDQSSIALGGPLCIDISICALPGIPIRQQIQVQGYTSSLDNYQLNNTQLNLGTDQINEIQRKHQQTSEVRSANEVVDRQVSRVNIVQENNAKIQTLIGGFLQISEQLSIKSKLQTDFTTTLLRVLSLGNFSSVNTLLAQIYSIYEPALTVMDASKIFYHLLNICAYQFPFNEVLACVSNAGIHSVTHQVSQIPNVNEERGSFLLKFLPVSESPQEVRDVSDVFCSTLNSVRNTIGLCGHIDFTCEPFNNLDFWLQGTNNIKRKQTLLNISMIDKNGEITVNRFLFDQQGLFLEMIDQPKILPLQIYGDNMRIVNLKEFIEMAHFKIPMLASCLTQDLFMKTHQFNESLDQVEEARMPYTVLVNGSFRVRFDPSVDSHSDITLATPQRIFNDAQIQRMFKKGIDNVYTIQISAVKKQENFLSVKQRVSQIIKEIARIEGLKNIPDILTDNIKFQAGNKIFDSFDRITNQAETSFDLVRIEDEEDISKQYSSLAMYTHPSGEKQWRPCKIIQRYKSTQLTEETLKIEFLHDRNAEYPVALIYTRDNVLISFDFKAQQSDYFTKEIRAIVDKISTNEDLIQDEDALNYMTNNLYVPDSRKPTVGGQQKAPIPDASIYRNSGRDIMFQNASQVFDPEVMAEMNDVDISQMNNQ